MLEHDNMNTTETTATVSCGSFLALNSGSLHLRPAMRMRNGFTLVEVVLTVVIIGILATVALRTGGAVFTTAKVENTKQELDALANAIVGNPELENNGVRSDFGYVGDIGSMPPNLDALVSNPGGYSTWKGPYVQRRFSQMVDDHKKDAWNTDYEYSAGVTIKSVGDPAPGGDIIRHLAASTSALLLNSFSGIIYDADGTPPGSNYSDSLVVLLTVPDGSGSTTTRSVVPDAGGYFGFDLVPIGNHDLRIVYLPGADTARRFISIAPNGTTYLEYRLASDLW